MQEKAAKAVEAAVAKKTANSSHDQKDLQKPVLVNQASKDGKIKSKDYNLFAQFNAKEDKNVKSQKSPSSDPSDGEDDVSERLKRQIAESINSYSLEKASNGDAKARSSSDSGG